MLGHVEKYHHGRYSEVGRVWLIAPDGDRVFHVPDICPNCESRDISVLSTPMRCYGCKLELVPDY